MRKQSRTFNYNEYCHLLSFNDIYMEIRLILYANNILDAVKYSNCYIIVYSTVG